MGALAGRRVVVTRRKGQSAALSDGLRERGADVIELPAIDIVPPSNLEPLDAALAALDEYDWVVVTSPNTVAALLSRMTVQGHYPRLTSARTRLASIGPATTAALRASFPEDRVALEPARDYSAAGLLAAFEARDFSGRRVLLPVSSLARDELAQGLAVLGASVEKLEAYRTVEPPGLAEGVASALARGFDLALFASPSAVETFAHAAGKRSLGLPVVVIGPTTEAAAAAAGFDVRGVASPSTVEALIGCAAAVLGKERP
jgi:uroporphyrinogen-III synthase